MLVLVFIRHIVDGGGVSAWNIHCSAYPVN